MQDSDKNEINTKVAALRETLKNGTVDQIKAGMDDLQKAVYAASEKLYQQQAPQGGQPGQQPPYQGGNPGDNGGNNGGDGNVYDLASLGVSECFSLRTAARLAAWE